MREPTATIGSEADDRLTLLVLPGREAGGFTLYDDDRETYAYEGGEFSLQHFAVSAIGLDGTFTLTIGAIKGEHVGAVLARSYRIELPLSLAQPNAIALGGRALTRSDNEPVAGQWRCGADRIVIELPVIDGTSELAFQ
jgi:hypothetical protein